MTTISESYPRLGMEMELQGEGTETLIMDRRRLESGKPVLLEKLAARNVQSAVHENLTKLKELTEEGQVILQDGRKSGMV